MRKTLCVPAVLIAVLAVAGAAIAGPADEKPWFDSQICAFCKQMTDQPGLIEHFQMEYHNVGGGLVSVAYLDADYWDEYEKASQGMMAVAKEMESGKTVPMCGHCEKIGELMMKGVKMEQVKSEKCIIHIYSTQDPAMVQEVHAFGDRCVKEIAKRTAAQPE
jgi:hypothetical protein